MSEDKDDSAGGARAPVRKESRLRKATAYLKLAADVASIIMDLRDKPTGKDWYSLGIRAVNTGLGWYNDRGKKLLHASTWDYFNEDSRWSSFPSEYRPVVLKAIQDLEVAPEYLDGDPKNAYVAFGYLRKKIKVGIVMDSGQITDGPYYLAEQEEDVFRTVGELAWKQLGGRHLVYTTSNLVLDGYVDKNVRPTKQMEQLLERVKKFLAAKEPRGYLFGGVPGTGKSVAIRWLVGTLGLTSVRVDLRMLDEGSSHLAATTLPSILRILRPDVIILDDIDRIEVTAELLDFLELAKSSCRIVLGSANDVESMHGAQVRPGRFDDIFEFSNLDFSVVEEILGENRDLAELVKDLPAAYVAEFGKRCRVLGREQAVDSLGELLQRAADVGAG